MVLSASFGLDHDAVLERLDGDLGSGGHGNPPVCVQSVERTGPPAVAGIRCLAAVGTLTRRVPALQPGDREGDEQGVRRGQPGTGAAAEPARPPERARPRSGSAAAAQAGSEQRPRPRAARRAAAAPSVIVALYAALPTTAATATSSTPARAAASTSANSSAVVASAEHDQPDRLVGAAELLDQPRRALDRGGAPGRHQHQPGDDEPQRQRRRRSARVVVVASASSPIAGGVRSRRHTAAHQPAYASSSSTPSTRPTRPSSRTSTASSPATADATAYCLIRRPTGSGRTSAARPSARGEHREVGAERVAGGQARAVLRRGEDGGEQLLAARRREQDGDGDDAEPQPAARRPTRCSANSSAPATQQPRREQQQQDRRSGAHDLADTAGRCRRAGRAGSAPPRRRPAGSRAPPPSRRCRCTAPAAAPAARCPPRRSAPAASARSRELAATPPPSSRWPTPALGARPHGLGGQHVDDRLLEARAHVGDRHRLARRLPRLDPARDRGLEPAERHVVASARAASTAGTRSRRGSPSRAMRSTTGPPGKPQPEQAGDLVERLARGVVDGRAERLERRRDVVDAQEAASGRPRRAPRWPAAGSGPCSSTSTATWAARWLTP